MDSSARLCLRDSLYTVNSTLIFHLGICTITCDHEYRFLETTDSILIHAHQFYFPFELINVFLIHSVDLICK
jgi:hypothetical protein